MTDEEKVVIMAYTGYYMLTEDKLSLFYKYASKLFGRPVFTHELASEDFYKQLQNFSRPDFIRICNDEKVVI